MRWPFANYSPISWRGRGGCSPRPAPRSGRPSSSSRAVFSVAIPPKPSRPPQRLTWQVAERDDGAVAHAVYRGEELDGVHPQGEVGLLDEFFHFLGVSRVLPLLGNLDLPPIKHAFVPVIQFVGLYLLKTLLGIESMNALPVLLFSNEAAMAGRPLGRASTPLKSRTG